MTLIDFNSCYTPINIPCNQGTKHDPFGTEAQKLAKMHKFRHNKIFGGASQWSTGFWEANMSLVYMVCGSLSPLGWWKFWQSWVKVAFCCLRHTGVPGSVPVISPLPGYKYHLPLLLLPFSLPRQNKSRWQPQVAVHDSYGRGAAGRCCCAVVAIIQTDQGLCYIVYPPQHLLNCETVM